jgi:hypothetical protein
MKTFLIAALGLLLMACAGSAPRIDPARIAALQIGQTTVDEVVRQFGRPSVLSKNPDGTQSARYLYGGDGQSGTTMVPLLASTLADSTIFYFDTKGVLTEYKTTQASAVAPAEAAKPAATQAVAAKPAPPVTSSKPAPPSTVTTTTTAKGTTSATKTAPAGDSMFFPGATKENR